MATKALPLIAVSALVLAACDFSQTNAETARTQLSTSASPEAPAQPFAMRATPGGMQDTTDTPSGTSGAPRAGAERSIRLYGPGVSRKLQIHI